MGSTGSGSFTDYSKRKPTNSDEANGGASGVDKCGTAFSAGLEEVARCFYFINYGDVPPVGTAVTVTFNGHRLAVETTLGEEIGYLPTRFNYIKVCLDSAFTYGGVVSSARAKPSPNVSVDIIPI
ncbi:hypothetical protein [Mucilaginibacter segetis]|uniref:Uncharacterized protein n=1 Tax=Mucilaginibacter segetis TaxID=2793071 RepID=A0A934UM21_9SPHI|nr:hypothetical protein [Mucilaginibacter segetis]MBK0378565.1 hypothetical protein [Mucilaginibacter segetis]